jgi:hypothetical protein
MTTLNALSPEDGLVRCYVEEILPAKTREVSLLGRKCTPQLLYTFLGYEIKLGTKRVTCPDMTTARYLRIFGQLGLVSVEIPYDPTLTARILPVLEHEMEKIDRWLQSNDLTRIQQQRKARRVYRRIRQKLKQARSTALDT